MDLLATVSDTAAIACFLEQEEMMQEVVKGVSKNRFVAGITLISSNGYIVHSGQKINPPDQNQDYIIRYPLSSPFQNEESTESEHIGMFILLQHKGIIDKTAYQDAQKEIFSLILITILTACLTSALVYVLFTRPITNIANLLHKTKPGSLDLLKTPALHSKNEIGSLLSDINALLKRNAQALNAEKSLRNRLSFLEKRYRTIFEKANSGIFLANENGKVSIHNPFFMKLAQNTGDSKKVLDNFTELFVDSSKVEMMVKKAFKKEQATSSDLIIKTKDSYQAWVHAVFINCKDDLGAPIIECMLYDITQRHRQEEQNRKIAKKDHLTGLLNRRGGEIQMDYIISTCQPEHSIAFFLMDLDGFKHINDTYGHDGGDKVLIEVSRRMQSINRATDTIIRWGGDEFVLILYGDIDKETCFGIGEKILQSLNSPIDIGNDVSDSVGASIGISIMSAESAEKDILLQSADKAMYAIKQQGKNGIYYSDMNNNTYETRFF